MFRTWNGTKPILWKRYIDDILFFWQGSEEELTAFVTHLNGQHDYIEFEASYDISTRSVPFLDMEVSIGVDNKIHTDLHMKDTAVCQYLLPSSCHPHHVTANIPFSLSYRLLRICSSQERFEFWLDKLKKDLIARNYKPKIIQDAFVRIRGITREQALMRVEKKGNERKPPPVVTYHPSLPPVAKLVRKFWGVMTKENPGLKKIFKAPSVVAYRRSKNLRDMLVRAKLAKRKCTRHTGGFFPCRRFCELCKMSGKHTSHTNKVTGQTWSINSKITCLTTNVVYKVLCRKCEDWFYIGETGRRLCDRAENHRGYANRRDDQNPVGRHFSLPGHDARDIQIFGIEEVTPKNDDMLRKRRESYWIHKYDAVSQGANTRL